MAEGIDSGNENKQMNYGLTVEMNNRQTNAMISTNMINTTDEFENESDSDSAIVNDINSGITKDESEMVSDNEGTGDDIINDFGMLTPMGNQFIVCDEEEENNTPNNNKNNYNITKGNDYMNEEDSVDNVENNNEINLKEGNDINENDDDIMNRLDGMTPNGNEFIIDNEMEEMG